MAETYVNLRVIADRLMRHPLMTDLTLETILDYTVDFMRICGVPRMYMDKVEQVEVQDYRAMLPCDWMETIQIRPIIDGRPRPAMRYSSDNFHMNPNKNSSPDPTFKIQGNIIYTSFECGTIEIAYRAIAMDAEGYPLIPDNSKYLRALEYYIRKEYFTILFDMGKITSPILNNTQQSYAFYVGQAQNEFIKLDLSRAESFFNGWSALLPRDNAFPQGFGSNGAREYLRVKS